MIGFDDYLVWLRKEQNYTLQILKDAFLACFYTFLKLKNSHVLAIYEIGAIKTDFSGQVTWQTNFSDVVVDYRIDNEKILSVTFMEEEGKNYYYDIDSGNQVNV